LLIIIPQQKTPNLATFTDFSNMENDENIQRSKKKLREQRRKNGFACAFL
jgi:hypothetical protein